MQLIALTGGIASGKSTVARRFAEHGAVVIDADVLAREAVEPGTQALAAITERFGTGVIAPDGSLDRAALGAIVFSDERSRLELNAITHPAVRKLLMQRVAAARQHDPDAIIVYDVPLLVEGSEGKPTRFDSVVVVLAGRTERIRRLTQLRGMSAEEAALRIDSQATDTERRAIADHTIDANGTLEATIRQADDYWAQLTS